MKKPKKRFNLSLLRTAQGNKHPVVIYESLVTINAIEKYIDELEVYYNWFIKEKCVLKEDLPSVEEIEKILSRDETSDIKPPYKVLPYDHIDWIKLKAKTLAKKIRKVKR